MKTYLVEVPVTCKRLFTVQAESKDQAKSKVYMQEVNHWAVAEVREDDREEWDVREVEEA